MKCAQEGLSQEDVAKIVSELGTQFGSNVLEDSPENDYGSGIADTFRNIWTPSEVMAKKQRRFEKNYKKKRGVSKIWEQMKHPVRSARADGTSGAMGLTAGVAATIIAQLIAARSQARSNARANARAHADFERHRNEMRTAFEQSRAAAQERFDAFSKEHGFN